MKKATDTLILLIFFWGLAGFCPLTSAYAETQGDINGDGQVNLADVIVSLQALVGLQPSPLDKESEVSGDGKIGIEETIYILQDISGLRIINQPPTASFTTSLMSGEAPLDVEFNGSASWDEDGFIAAYFWTFGDNETGAGVITSHTYTNPGTYKASLTVTDNIGATNIAYSGWIVVTGQTEPPGNPVESASEVDPTVATILAPASEFLYLGENPVQVGMNPDTIVETRAAVLRGLVSDHGGSPLAGVKITILNHPEYGQTLSRADGMFDLAVNGGGSLTVNYEMAGYLSAQRQLNVPWQDYVWLPDVVLATLDTAVTTIDLTEPGMQVARGSVVSDSDGTRQATILFPEATQAQVVMPDGSTLPVSTLNVRATEYTVGSNGPQAMPAELPPTSAYTYAIELSADQAIAVNAKTVHFSQPVYFYVENFLGFPCGIQVPTAYYDMDQAAWVPVTDGKVINIVSISGGLAELDTDGDDIVDNGIALGITEAERLQLGSLYGAGQSLWRVAVTHFTAYDLNYGVVPPPGAKRPDMGGITSTKKLDDPTIDPSWGAIEIENQVFRETASITGTPYSLHYASDRLPGFMAKNSLQIPLSNDTIPPSLKRIELEIYYGGRRFAQSFPPAVDQEYTFFWDGQDSYGRQLQGQQPVIVRIGYVYDGYYALPPDMAATFGMPSGIRIPGDIPARQEVILWQDEQHMLNLWDAKSLGLGGWSLSPHHAYDPLGKVLYLGDGRQRSVDNMATVFETYAGGGSVLGDGGPATEANLYYPRDLAVGPDGSLYIVDEGHLRVRRVAPDGTISTVAGNGVYTCTPTSTCGDGGPAVQASVFPMGIAVGPDGSLYISDANTHRIRKVGPDGIITRVAGAMIDTKIYNGDEIPALDAVINPAAIEIAPDGTIYFIDDISNVDNIYRDTVRRISPDGIIHRYAGTGQDWNCDIGTSCGDGGPATEALVRAFDISLAVDGSLYLYGENTYTIRRVGTDGIIETVAGKYDDLPGMEDGVPATETHFFPRGIALDRNGLLHIGETGWWEYGGPHGEQLVLSHRVRRVGSDQIITTVAGGTNNYFYSDEDEDGPAIGAHFRADRIAFGPDGSLYIADYLSQGRVYKVSSAFQGFDLGTIYIASEDGSQIYQFNEYGRHLKTINPLTGATLYEFGYDASNRLISIKDGDNNVTTISRDGNGDATAIRAPFGQITTLAMNIDGYLASVTNPASEKIEFNYGNLGLLTSVKSPEEHTFSFTYNTLGLLIGAENPTGGSSTLARTDTAEAYQVLQTSSLGLEDTYQVETLLTGELKRTNTYACCGQNESLIGTDGSMTTTFANGITKTTIVGPDPRFGMHTPLADTITLATPDGLTWNSSHTRSASLSDPENPLTMTLLEDVTTVNGRVFTNSYDTATRIMTSTTPEGRLSTAQYDLLGKLSQAQTSGLSSITLSYDGYGRLIQSVRGTRVSSLSYNAQTGWLEKVIDPLENTITFSRDPTGRVSSTLLPSGDRWELGWDKDNNLLLITEPDGTTVHEFGYTGLGQMSSYRSPMGAVENFEYNTDRQITRRQFPSGHAVEWLYNDNGLLETFRTPEGDDSFTYNAATGQLSQALSRDGQQVNFTYDGDLLKRAECSGLVTGAIDYTYDNDFRMTGLDFAGTWIPYSYDNDGLLIGAGSMTLARDANNGLLTGLQDGPYQMNYSWNTYGEIASVSALYNANVLFDVIYSYDDLGRIIQKEESLGGVSHTWQYDYDNLGQLQTVKRDSVTVESYDYDNVGNRIGIDNTLTGVSLNEDDFSYDADNKLLEAGTTSYSYDDDGRVSQVINGSSITTYNYNTDGTLASVALPGGQEITYRYDHLGRRVARSVDAVPTHFWLYGEGLMPLAQFDGSGTLKRVFIYTSSNVPTLMIENGVSYHVITDHLGSPRLIVDSNGNVVKRLDYDSFGNVITDTNPGFYLVFGFAGGMKDPQHELIRFGLRDYQPSTGRWTAKDPILFNGGDLNLYGYIGNSPTNSTDTIGLGPNKNRYPGPNLSTIGKGLWQFGSGTVSTTISGFVIIETAGVGWPAYLSLLSGVTNITYGLWNIEIGIFTPEQAPVKTPTEAVAWKAFNFLWNTTSFPEDAPPPGTTYSFQDSDAYVKKNPQPAGLYYGSYSNPDMINQYQMSSKMYIKDSYR